MPLGPNPILLNEPTAELIPIYFGCEGVRTLMIKETKTTNKRVREHLEREKMNLFIEKYLYLIEVP
jgi:hypothetical protein